MDELALLRLRIQALEEENKLMKQTLVVKEERRRIKGRVKEAAENLWCIRNEVVEEVDEELKRVPYSLYIGPSINTLEEFVDRLLEEDLIAFVQSILEADRESDDELISRLRMAMHDIYEVYAGSEGFIPETCPEAYLQERIKEMAYIAGKHKHRISGEE